MFGKMIAFLFLDVEYHTDVLLVLGGNGIILCEIVFVGDGGTVYLGKGSLFKLFIGGG